MTSWYYWMMANLVVKTVKLPKWLAAALKRTAQERGCPESQLIREGIEHVTDSEDGIDMVAAIGADFGIGRGGPPDLSSNKKHMAGFGRSRNQ
jgi:hypothetical protein